MSQVKVKEIDIAKINFDYEIFFFDINTLKILKISLASLLSHRKFECEKNFKQEREAKLKIEEEKKK